MSKFLKHNLFLLSAFLIITGCGNSEQLDPSNCGNGYFCYKNINFGKTRGSDYEAGIRDGCKTGEGTFTKDYSMSSSSKDYYDGWILGRSKCKQILPNEGTIQDELNSKKRAEYQIQQMKLRQSSVDSDSQEGIVDKLLGNDKKTEDAQEVEY